MLEPTVSEATASRAERHAMFPCSLAGCTLSITEVEASEFLGARGGKKMSVVAVSCRAVVGKGLFEVCLSMLKLDHKLIDRA